MAGGVLGEQGAGNSVYIYSWNGTAYVQRGDPVTGLNYVRAFSLVQDVDGDGLNELVLSSDAGLVYCFGTQAKVSKPMVRSGITFYSEDRQGAAIYIPPAIPSQPVLKQESPVDRSVNQSLTPTLSVLVTSFQGYSLTVRFTGTDSFGTWNNIGGAFSGPSGVFSVPAPSMNKTGTKYYWNVTVIDSAGNRASSNYTFTTYSNPPTQNVPLLSSDNGGNLICSNQSTSDPNGNGVTNIYNWYVNNVSSANLYLPFDTRTSNNPMSSDVIFADGFENDNFNLWNASGITNWNIDASQAHSGNYSAHATHGDTYLTSNNIDTSSAGGITVSFWYKIQNISTTDNVYLQFWNGSAYKNIFQLANPSQNTWQSYSFQTYDPEFYISSFHIRFVASSISSTGKNVWIDDVSITVPTRTMDYSGHGNNGTVHGATWTSAGVVGGAYTFDGGTDYIRVNDNPSLGGTGTWSQMSIGFWIQLSAAQTGTTIIAKKVPSSRYASYMIGFEPSGTSPSDTLFWGINNDSTQNVTQSVWSNSTTVLNVGQWYYVVCTYESGQGLTIYINGTQAVNMPLTGNIMPGPGTDIYNQPLFIGWDGRSASGWFNGSLDEIMISPRAFTPNEIMQQYLQSENGFSNVSTIVSQETNLGEKWNCTITPNDSFGDGAPMTSNTVTPTNTTQWHLNVSSVHDTPVPPNGDNVYADGTSVNCSVTSLVTEGGNVWNCTGWTGTGSVPASGSGSSVTFTITQNSTITWNWTIVPIIWHLNVSSVHDTPVPPNGDNVYADGTSVNCSVTSLVTEGGNVWNCTGWTGTGSVPASGSGSSVTFTITQNSTITWNWTIVPSSPYIFANGFEPGDTPWTGNATTSGETISVVNSFSHSGSHSGLFTTVGSGGFEGAYCYESISSTTQVYSRGYFYVNASGITANNDRFYFIALKSGGNSGIYLAYAGWRMVGGVLKWELLIMNGTNYVSAYSASSPALNQWYSVELDWTDNSTNGTGELYVNGALACSISSVNTAALGSANVVRFGLAELYNCGPTAIYCDDCVISTQYIGIGAPVSWNLIVNSAHGTPNPNVGSYLYGDGSSVTCNVSSFVVENGTSYTCTGWTGTGSVPASGSGSSVTFTITQNSTITWNWMVTPTQFGLVVGVSGSGTTNATGTTQYAPGSTVSVNATPASGWTLSYWLLNGTNVGSANPYVVTMNQNINLTAVFSPSVLFANGFEPGDTPWTGNATTSGETISVVNSFSHSGSHSGLFTTVGSGGFEGAYCYESISSTTQVYSRGYFYVNASGITANNDRFYFIALKSGGNSGIYLAYAGWRMVGGVLKWELLIMNGTNYVSAYSASSPALNQWYSVELDWTDNSTNGTGELYVNGALACSISSVNTAALGSANVVRFGLAELYNCGPTAIYCDDCVISTQYIGP